MSRKKTAALIGVITIIHFGLMITLFISRMSCGMQANCASAAVDVLRDILAFPMNLVSLALDHIGVDVDDFVRQYLHSEVVLVFFVNSLLASLALWFVVIKPLVRAVSRRSRRAV